MILPGFQLYLRCHHLFDFQPTLYSRGDEGQFKVQDAKFFNEFLHLDLAKLAVFYLGLE